MMGSKNSAYLKRVINLSISILLLGFIIWGLRVIIIEGFQFAGRRKWAGDFSSAFYDEIYWNDDGYMYGPVFTLIKAISNVFPETFSIEIFAFGNIPIFAATIVIIWKFFEIKTLRTTEKLGILALVCTFSHLYYAFSVSAFPEFLELFLICSSFQLLKMNYLKSSMIVLGIATMVKIVPVILVPFLLSIVGLQGMVVFLFTIVFFLTFIVIYLDTNYLDATFKVFEITVRGSSNIFHPESTEHFGLSSAIGRLEISFVTSKLIVTTSVFIIATIYVVVLALTQNLLHQIKKQEYLEFLLAITSALIPFVSSATHRHSFIFLIPMAFFIVRLKDKFYSSVLLIIFLLVSIPFYSIFNLEFGIARYLYHEPIVGNVIILILLISFGFKHVKREH